MKKELPHIYQNTMATKANRNKNVYHIPQKEERETVSSFQTVEEKLKKLFGSRRYIFNIGVEIVTAKKVYDTKIAGKVKNSIVTVDGDTIPMIEIQDIIIKDRLS